MRRPILAANWKMQKTNAEALAFADTLLPLVAEASDVGIVIAPPFTCLAKLSARLQGSPIQPAAQNVNPEASGAFTGEVAPGMLVELACAYTIVGHSERRSLYGEGDDFISRKALALRAHGIRPIVCVGETLEEREAEHTEAVVGAQLEGSLAGIDPADVSQVVIAYEPVWAIGTGRTATPETAQDAHAFIRSCLRDGFGNAAESIRIQYGGSVKPENVDSLMSQADIDGALVGGASLEAASFARIVNFEGVEG